MNLNNSEAARLYSQMPEHRRCVAITRKLIRKALKRVKNPYIACSFGKDSSVMLHLVLQELPIIDVLWVTFPETNLLNNYEEIITWWKAKYSINLYEIRVNVEINAEFDDRVVMTNYGDYDSYFVGIRSEEAIGRRITLKQHGLIYKMKSTGLVRICPMAYWRTENVAAYISSNNIPNLESYSEDGFEGRTTTGIPDDIGSIRSRSLNRLKNNHPARFNELITLCPELTIYR